MKNNDQIVLKSKVRGCLNFTKQKGKVNADSDVDGNLNYTSQELPDDEKCNNKVSWWTKTHVICVVITTIIAVLGFLVLHNFIKL